MPADRAKHDGRANPSGPIRYRRWVLSTLTLAGRTAASAAIVRALPGIVPGGRGMWRASWPASCAATSRSPTTRSASRPSREWQPAWSSSTPAHPACATPTRVGRRWSSSGPCSRVATGSRRRSSRRRPEGTAAVSWRKRSPVGCPRSSAWEATARSGSWLQHWRARACRWASSRPGPATRSPRSWVYPSPSRMRSPRWQRSGAVAWTSERRGCASARATKSRPRSSSGAVPAWTLA